MLLDYKHYQVCLHRSSEGMACSSGSPPRGSRRSSSGRSTTWFLLVLQGGLPRRTIGFCFLKWEFLGSDGWFSLIRLVHLVVESLFCEGWRPQTWGLSLQTPQTVGRVLYRSVVWNLGHRRSPPALFQNRRGHRRRIIRRRPPGSPPGETPESIREMSC